MSADRSPRLSLRSPRTRKLLARDLPGLPPEFLDADSITLSIIAHTWLGCDDRREQERLLNARPVETV